MVNFVCVYSFFNVIVLGVFVCLENDVNRSLCGLIAAVIAAMQLNKD